MVLVALEGRKAATVREFHEGELPAQFYLWRLRAKIHCALLPPGQLGQPVRGRRGEVSAAARGGRGSPSPARADPSAGRGLRQVKTERGKARRLAGSHRCPSDLRYRGYCVLPPEGCRIEYGTPDPKKVRLVED